MVLVLVVLVPCVLLAGAAVWVLRAWPAPVELGADEADAPTDDAPPTIRILTTDEELRAAIERAVATERRLATIVGGRADRYDRLNHRGTPGPALAAARLTHRARPRTDAGEVRPVPSAGWSNRQPS